uniref:Chemokine interleukin-8-like domain-containing protein n=1 Tax=Gasterosteus aculeatus aculeatus TaxID=481459 RepID=G3Q1U6_GASAC
MSGIMKVFLLLAVMFCISEAQHTSVNQCLCENVQRGIQRGTKMKDIQIQIYPPSVFCDRVEICQQQQRPSLLPEPRVDVGAKTHRYNYETGALYYDQTNRAQLNQQHGSHLSIYVLRSL